MLIDTHVHLNNETLYESLEKVIETARLKNVDKMLVIGFDPLMNERAIAIAESHDNIYASVGIHPTHVNDMMPHALTRVEELITHGKVKAVGECGLDLYWQKDNEKEQIDVFKKQIELAQANNLPLVIHMREATEITYEILKPYAPIKGVMHCYSGSAEMAEKFMDLGLHISLGGPVTFKNAKKPKEVARIVREERLLVETDAPFLAPHPHRGKTNEPGLLPLIVEAIAKERGSDYETIAALTTHNAKTLFDME